MNNLMDRVQASLNYQSTGAWNPQFRNSGAGMMGTTGYLIGLCGGIHLGMVLMIMVLNFSGLLGVHESMPAFLVNLLHWSTYVALLCTFHFLEFFSTALWQPKVLSYDSFIVNHSRNYTIAVVASALEYWTEQFFFPSMKHNSFVAWLGLAVVLSGQAIRTAAMWTCKENFAHQIMHQRTEGHQLVTHGIYKYLRHPSYFGWFYWSIGTQMLLCNPISFFLYAYASWSFFNSRIPYEEETLVQFYAQDYVDYCRSAPIGIPFIKSAIPFSASSTGISGSSGSRGYQEVHQDNS